MNKLRKINRWRLDHASALWQIISHTNELTIKRHEEFSTYEVCPFPYPPSNFKLPEKLKVREGAYCLLNSQHSFRRYLRYYGHSVSNFPTDEAELGSLVSKMGGLEKGKALGKFGTWKEGEGVSQWYGHPRVLSIPIPNTLVIWASPVTLTLTTKVIWEGNAHITIVLGMGMPISL